MRAGCWCCTASPAWASRRCWTTWPGGCGLPARAGGGCAVGDGAGLRGAAPAVRADAGSLDGLPAPQREALRTAFGLSAGPAPDRFLVGLAVLGLLSDAAGERPLFCVIDDQQWLDRASAQALAFVARRLGADPVGLVFGDAGPGPELAGLPSWR